MDLRDSILKQNQHAIEALNQGDTRTSLRILRGVEEQLKAAQGTRDYKKLMWITYSNLGTYYKRTGNLQLALEYLSKVGDQPAYSMASIVQKSGAYLNICTILSQQNKHQAALQHALMALTMLQEAYAVNDQNNSLVHSLVVAYHNAGVEYEILKELDKAIQFFRSGLDLAQNQLPPGHQMIDSLKKSVQQFRFNNMKTARQQRTNPGTVDTRRIRSDRSDSSMSRKSKGRRPNANYMYDPRRKQPKTRNNSNNKLNPIRHSIATNRAPTQSKSGRIIKKLNTSLPDNYVYSHKGSAHVTNMNNSIEHKLQTLEKRVNTVIKGSDVDSVTPKVNPFKSGIKPSIDDLIPYKPPANTEPGFYQRKHRQSEPGNGQPPAKHPSTISPGRRRADSQYASPARKRTDSYVPSSVRQRTDSYVSSPGRQRTDSHVTSPGRQRTDSYVSSPARKRPETMAPIRPTPPPDIKIPNNEMTNACAIMIQKLWRGYAYRKTLVNEEQRQKDLENRAQTAINQFEELKKLASRERTTDIPSFTRGSLLQHRRFKNIKRHKFTGRHEKAITIQSAVRRFLAKCRFLRKHKAILTIQKNIRKWYCESLFEKILSAVVYIQRMYRLYREIKSIRAAHD